MNALVHVNKGQGIHQRQRFSSHEMKKKNLPSGFLYSKIMAKEAFHLVILSSINLLFLQKERFRLFRFKLLLRYIIIAKRFQSRTRTTQHLLQNHKSPIIMQDKYHKVVVAAVGCVNELAPKLTLQQNFWWVPKDWRSSYKSKTKKIYRYYVCTYL